VLAADARRDARAFVEREIVPHAGRFERQQAIDRTTVRALARRGYLGAGLPLDSGAAPDPLAWGVLHEEIGRGCSSVRSLLTVHSMVGTAIARWGGPTQRRRWLPAMRAGDVVAAFAVTEAGAGSDLEGIRTTAVRDGSGYVLTGTKCWVTAAGLADVFLVAARVAGQPAVFLVERAARGVTLRPAGDMLGLRASMTADVEMVDCRVGEEAMVGRIGFGLNTVIATALDLGRYSVAWGSVGIAQACLDASLAHASTRTQFGAPLAQHQLVRRHVANMVTGVTTARLACTHAASLRAAADPSSVIETCVAKYVAARVCNKAAAAAVQIHGAIGCSSRAPVERYYRDAKIMEIIEGSTEMQQLLIAEHALAAFANRSDASTLAENPALAATF
jgi:glutaryl-CoA dehydrogenase (non-decarboxylating)